MKYHNYPTVRFSQLITDGTNFKDKAFEAYVDKWMQQYMPGFPIDLLDTDNSERWQMETPTVHSVEEGYSVVYRCEGCGEEHIQKPEEVCCREQDDDGKVISHSFIQDGKLAWVVRNDITGELLGSQRYIRHERLSEDYDDFRSDGEEVLAWDDKSEAEEAAEKADACWESEHGHENSYGFPWANSWAFMPDGYVQTSTLKAAGFVVGTYVGGSGNWRSDSEHRLCGIDGGGYSFKGAHFAKLVALHHEAREIDIPTDNGPAYVTTDERSELQILADTAKEAI